MHSVAPVDMPVLNAPAHWRTIDFISDLHLQHSDPATFEAWRHYLQSTAADALFILGDLFEVWVGDDVLDSDANAGFEAQCQQLLAQASSRMDVFFMHGNRDFLVGDAFAQAAKLHLLHDPTVLAFDQQRWLLSHGDALCLQDTDYQQFRLEVRSPQWQAQFLARPLAQRLELARALRTQSEARKQGGASYGDLDEEMMGHWLLAAQATTLIHGHTHRPGNHPVQASAATTTLASPLNRLVLSDWDAQATVPRLQVLRLQCQQAPARLHLNPLT